MDRTGTRFRQVGPHFLTRTAFTPSVAFRLDPGPIQHGCPLFFFICRSQANQENKPIVQLANLVSQVSMFRKDSSSNGFLFQDTFGIIDSVGGLVNFSPFLPCLFSRQRLGGQGLEEIESVSFLPIACFELDFKFNLFIMLTCSSSEIRCPRDQYILGNVFQDRS